MSVSLMLDTDSEDELPLGWQEVLADDQKVYYVHEDSNTSHEAHPQSGIIKQLPEDLPYGWEKKVCEKTGKDLFYNAREERTSRIDPRLAFPIINHQYDIMRMKHDSATTASQVLQGRRLTNLHVIITGANQGIGYETARSLANTGATVVMACRDWRKAREAVQSIKKENPEARVEVMKMDLSDLKSVVSFAEEYQNNFKRLDVLIINAAVFWTPFKSTQDGFEYTFQVNFLAHRLLIRQLSCVLLYSAPSRLVFLVPECHRFSDLNCNTISWDLLSAPTHHNHHPLMAYNLSKMCLALLCLHLHRRWSGRGLGSVMVHPGNMIYTKLVSNPCWLRLLHICCTPFSKSPEQAAAVVVYAAVAREMEGKSGVYLNNFLEIPASPHTNDLSLCHHLFTLSSQMLSSLQHSKLGRNDIKTKKEVE